MRGRYANGVRRRAPLPAAELALGQPQLEHPGASRLAAELAELLESARRE